jgi:hypothetical protein
LPSFRGSGAQSGRLCNVTLPRQERGVVIAFRFEAGT